MKKHKTSLWILIGFIGMIFIIAGLSGCETCKGAAKGFQRDIQHIGDADDWIRENLW